MTTLLDIERPEALADYLRRTGRVAADARPRITVLAGGVSNRTVLVELDDGTSWVLKQALAKLRVQVEWLSDPKRIRLEALGLRLLPGLTPPGTIPALIFEDPEHDLLAMAAVPQPHRNWKQLLLGGGLEPGHVEQFARILGQIHARSNGQAAALAPLLANRSFFETLRLEPYYLYAGTQASAAAAFLAALVEETRGVGLAAVHGDYSPKNVLVAEGRLILLDHEVIHWGDPAFDVGFSMTHLLSKAHHVVAQRAAFLAAARHYWATYSAIVGERFGARFEARAARHLAACLLARAIGRSPLEYLDTAARERQRRAALVLIAAPPARIPDLIATFHEEISR
jgi:5-methylthioribose kinase